MTQDHRCPRCNRLAAKEYPRKLPQGRVVPMGRARLRMTLGLAPKIECVCGHKFVLLKASQG